MDRVRFGTLGAARITPAALVRPARKLDEAEVVAVAARDRERAGTFAKKHGIPTVLTSYDELVSHPDVDAVYNPLPNSLHCKWTLAALEAGKHVLCEKPFTSNAEEAELVAQAAERSGRVVIEAFHWRYHPLAARMKEIVDSGELGDIRHVEASLCFPLPKRSDIRWQLDLAGGATMDAGCYPISMVRHLAGAEPEVISAHARLRSPEVDRAMTAELRFADGRTGRIQCSMWSATVLRMRVRVVGDKGEMRVFNPLANVYHRLRVTTPAGRRAEHVRDGTTYFHQLKAFCAAVLRGAPVLTPPSDAVANMRVIDAVYRAAGLQRRG